MKTITVLTTAAACLVGTSVAAPLATAPGFNPFGMSVVGWMFEDKGCQGDATPIHPDDLIDGQKTFDPEQGYKSFQMGVAFDMFQDPHCRASPQTYRPMECGQLNLEASQCGRAVGGPVGGIGPFNPSNGANPLKELSPVTGALPLNGVTGALPLNGANPLNGVTGALPLNGANPLNGVLGGNPLNGANPLKGAIPLNEANPLGAITAPQEGGSRHNHGGSE